MVKVEHYTYTAGVNGGTTTLPAKFYTTARDDESRMFSGSGYTYDAVGNITRETDLVTGGYTTYTYDVQNQLTGAKVYNAQDVLQKTYTYVADTYGNLRSVLYYSGLI